MRSVATNVLSSLALPLLAAPSLAAVELADCEGQFGPTARCGWVTVPEDRAVENGRTIELRVVVLPAAGGESAEPWLLFPGGPGQATTGLIPVARQLYGRVQERRDVVFIGQRGAGESNPMSCLEDVGSDPSLVFGQVFDSDSVASCHTAALEHADPSRYTTGDYVDDLGAALDALGYDKAVLWGGSGGTRTAVAFMRAYPDRAIAAVLDGVTPLEYGMPLPFSGFAQTAWERVMTDCAAQASCAEAFPDLAGKMVRILATLDKGPVPTEITLQSGSTATVTVGRGDFAYAIRGVLYSANATAQLPAQIHAAASTGDLSFFAQAHYNRSAALLGGALSVGLHLSTYCAEDVPLITDEVVRAQATGTFLGAYLVGEYRAACEAWPVEPVDSSWYESFESAVPTLLLSGWYDPSTPDAAAESVRESLTNSTHLVIRNAGHGAGFTCARAAVEEFLVTADLSKVGTPCPDRPIEFAVDGS